MKADQPKEETLLASPFRTLSSLSWGRRLLWNWPFLMALVPWVSEFIDDGSLPKNFVGASTETVLTVVIIALVAMIQSQRKRILQFAITDGLTGLFNSNHFPERLTHETSMARRFGSSLSVIFLDIDNLKSVNDRYGHQSGSAFLAHFGHLLADQVRNKVDLCFRFGGDEFVVLCPRADMSEAESIANRIVDAVRLSSLFEKGMTVSAGLAVFQITESAGTFLKRADQALYMAKAEGKNRVKKAVSL